MVVDQLRTAGDDQDQEIMIPFKAPPTNLWVKYC